MAARTNSSWAPRGPRRLSRPSLRMRFKCANRGGRPAGYRNHHVAVAFACDRPSFRGCVRLGDGYGGWPECGPFDSIVVTAALGQPPPPLIEQLKAGGRLVMPVGSSKKSPLQDDNARRRTRALCALYVFTQLKAANDPVLEEQALGGRQGGWSLARMQVWGQEHEVRRHIANKIVECAGRQNTWGPEADLPQPPNSGGRVLLE